LFSLGKIEKKWIREGNVFIKRYAHNNSNVTRVRHRDERQSSERVVFFFVFFVETRKRQRHRAEERLRRFV